MGRVLTHPRKLTVSRYDFPAGSFQSIQQGTLPVVAALISMAVAVDVGSQRDIDDFYLQEFIAAWPANVDGCDELSFEFEVHVELPVHGSYEELQRWRG